MASTVTVKRNDIGVEFTDTLTVGGSAVDLSGATVLFLMLHDGGTLVSQTATVVTAASGTVKYVTVDGDLDTSGRYRQEWQATLADSSVLTFPSDGWNTVIVLDDLNPA